MTHCIGDRKGAGREEFLLFTGRVGSREAVNRKLYLVGRRPEGTMGVVSHWEGLV